MKHIFYIPIGDDQTASSRLRVWNIQPFIENSHIGIADHYEKGDVLIIQKTPQIDELRRAKSQGARVIYDIDDYYWDNPQFMKMIDECDLVTTDTEKKVEYLRRKWSPDKEIVVIPDSLDWDGSERKDFNKGIIGWTGYGNNSQYLNPIIDKLPKEFKLRLITSVDWINYIKAPAHNVQSRPWSLQMVDKYLAECEMGIYYLPEGEFEQCKGMHKLLKNWAIGLPTYTSRMPDYVKAMKEAGVGEKYLVDDWSKLKNIGFDVVLMDEIDVPTVRIFTSQVINRAFFFFKF
jgi:hypothetical protein